MAYYGPRYQGSAYDRAEARRAEAARRKPLPYCTAQEPCGSGRCMRCNDDG